ncbi:S41 family peptidase [Pedobacter insulae]|uniref:Carboxyl-terminal processing protease n=1 Tax=Pedobacter insulae TaxID=414048 RepID=A0A1I2Z0A5_9SPHI|nr:S41 family peptidase [Pedobacter insulae]SFH31254.1 carboxyl-terminal processing protease [Pedobacter insulae]
MKKFTRYNLLIALTYSVTLIGGMFLGYKFLKDQGFKVEPRSRYAENHNQKVDDIIHIIKKNYVDEVNADSLQHLPIDSLLHQLDPHSIYLPPTKAFEMAESLEGNFEGIGVEYYILNDTLLVTHVLKDGPAFLAGLKQGDRILKIDSNVVSGRSLPRSEMTGKIKGKRGTPVQLLIARAGLVNPTLLTIKRGKVDVSSVDAAYMLNPETAYIRISKFGANTDRDFVEAVKNLKTKGMRKLVLDLRDNGGGYVTAATSLANQFLQENKLIVYTQGKHEPRTDYFATGGGEFEQGKLAVLINENSASASEIFAGAIQDLDRGIIVGRRSFGKGLVQEQFPFEDGSALNLTIARYYTPLGRSIQKSYKKGYAAYQHELEDRLNDGELTAKAVVAKDTVQKGTAYITAGGKKVFSGGGIQPDVYVKLDTLGYNKFYATLVNKKVLIDFVFNVLAERYLPTYLAQNLESFTLSDNDFKDLINYIQSKNIKIEPKQLAASKSIIYNDMKVMLCKYHLGDIGYYKASNLTDPVVRTALNSLQ